VALAGNWTILQTSSAVCPLPWPPVRQWRGPSRHAWKDPGHPDPHGAHETRSRPMASKKEIKNKIAARQAKIAKHEGKIKKLKKALK